MSKTTLESIRKTLAKLERQVAGYEHQEKDEGRKARTRELIILGGIVRKNRPNMSQENLDSLLQYLTYLLNKDNGFLRSWIDWEEANGIEAEKN